MLYPLCIPRPRGHRAETVVARDVLWATNGFVTTLFRRKGGNEEQCGLWGQVDLGSNLTSLQCELDHLSTQSQFPFP